MSDNSGTCFECNCQATNKLLQILQPAKLLLWIFTKTPTHYFPGNDFYNRHVIFQVWI